MTFDPKRLAAFLSHKRVVAGMIASVDRLTPTADSQAATIHRLSVRDKDGMLVAFDPAPHPNLFARYEPKEGDWLVGYPNADGETTYYSISPKEAFEGGYALDLVAESVELAEGTPQESTLDKAMASGAD